MYPLHASLPLSTIQSKLEQEAARYKYWHKLILFDEYMTMNLPYYEVPYPYWLAR